MGLHRLARARISITVSSAGCVWSGPWRRRRFAWSDVVAVNLPDRTRATVALRLADGTRLACMPELFLGGGELVAHLREHLAAVPRGGA